jgi:hypothetical protein
MRTYAASSRIQMQLRSHLLGVIKRVLQMMKPALHHDTERSPLRGICLVVKDRPQRVVDFPRRPNPHAVSESIPLFFIARNHRGLWVAREAEGRTGGIFLFRHSALRFAENNRAGTGCATMFLTDRFELDVANRGGRIAGLINGAMRMAVQHLPGRPPARTAAPSFLQRRIRGH